MILKQNEEKDSVQELLKKTIQIGEKCYVLNLALVAIQISKMMFRLSNTNV